MDGISITHGSSPRKHIWTFVVGLSHSIDWEHGSNCPCAQYNSTKPPSFVGNDYYCDSANPDTRWSDKWYLNEVLWDGKCYVKSNCCKRPDLPYFVKSLGQSVKDALEVRLCRDEGQQENVGLQSMKLFVR